MLRARFLSLLLLVLTTLIGCGDGIPVSGKVTLDGEPLAAGVIKFVPAAGVDAPTTSTSITDGGYAFGSSDGPSAGIYAVEIYRDDPVPEGLDDPATFLEQEGKLVQPPNSVAPQFNRRTILKVEVTASGETEFDFQTASR